MLKIVRDHQEKNSWLMISCKRDLYFVGTRCNIKSAGVVFRVFHVSDSVPEGEKVKPIILKESKKFRYILCILTYSNSIFI